MLWNVKRRRENPGKLICVSFSPLHLHPHNIQQCTWIWFLYQKTPGCFFCRRIPLFCKLLVAISSIAQCLCVDIYRSSTKQPIFLLHLCPNMYHTIDSIPKHVTLQQRSQQRQSKSHQSEACLLSVCMWGDCSKTPLWSQFGGGC